MKITMDNIYAENGIAITGHSAGIGLALSQIFEEQGNKIVGRDVSSRIRDGILGRGVSN